MPGPASPDPVSDPAGYQQHLLGLLGDDDPAQVQAAGPAAWRSLVRDAGESVARSPEPNEWSALECLGHAVDAEIVSAARYRWIVAHDEPSLIGYDQALWVERLRHREQRAEELLQTFEVLRRSNLLLWDRSSDEERARVGVHAERGRESFDLLFRMIAGHDRFHLAQAHRALEAARP
ncbi:MAG TPA: DinB family protein [Actinomycetota bacterium]|nr:DinB family protein [Actinomycetota bacterium]